MNLGRRRVGNDELESAVEACGCRDVRAYQASGNVVLSDDRPEHELERALQGGLESELGYAVPAFLRTDEEVLAIAAATPFSNHELNTSLGKPQVILLQSFLSAETREDLKSVAPAGEHLKDGGRALYWLPTDGVLDSQLDVGRLERLCGETTMRTHGTIKRLAAKYL